MDTWRPFNSVAREASHSTGSASSVKAAHRSLYEREIMKQHASISVPLKVAKVDKGIAPVVLWLNSFGDVFTRWSCEGKHRGEHNEPYIIFYCEEFDVLTEIVKQIDGYAHVVIEYYDIAKVFRYWMKFHNKRRLKSFVAKLAKGRVA